MACYFAMSFLREMAQLGIALGLKSGVNGLTDYILDFWNILDLGSLSAFFVGLFLRMECINDVSVCSWGDSTAVQRKEEGSDAVVSDTSSLLAPSPFESWALCYAICLLCCWFRVLRSFYMSRLGLIVSIFMAMIKDVAQFVLIYSILVLAMSMLFLGIGDLPSLRPECDADNEEERLWMSCRPSYFILRTLFQSFGDFYLEEMNNDAGVAFVIITFLILNVVLMNLLIAMMASTYEKVLEAANSERLLNTFYLMTGHSNLCMTICVRCVCDHVTCSGRPW